MIMSIFLSYVFIMSIFIHTIENNINLTEEDTDYNKLEDVVRFANLYDVIYSLPKKY